MKFGSSFTKTSAYNFIRIHSAFAFLLHIVYEVTFSPDTV